MEQGIVSMLLWSGLVQVRPCSGWEAKSLQTPMAIYTPWFIFLSAITVLHLQVLVLVGHVATEVLNVTSEYVNLLTSNGFKSRQCVYIYIPSSHPSRPYDKCTLPSTVEYQSLITFLDGVVPHCPSRKELRFYSRDKQQLWPLTSMTQLCVPIPFQREVGHIENTCSHLIWRLTDHVLPWGTPMPQLVVLVKGPSSQPLYLPCHH